LHYHYIGIRELR